MSWCRTLADIEAAAWQDFLDFETVRSQEWADRKEAILAPHAASLAPVPRRDEAPAA